MDVFTPAIADTDNEIFCFNAIVDEKGRLVVPAYIRKRLGIKRSRSVSVVIEAISTVKRFRVKSNCDVEKIVDPIDDVISYKCNEGYLEVTVGKGRCSR